MDALYEIPVTTIDGEATDLSQYEAQVTLVVNTASKCGFTSQYRGLQELYTKYEEQGFVVLGFPCDQFGHQEPGDEVEISKFCELTFGVTFPLFAKIEVNGGNAHPLYDELKKRAPGLLGTRAIKWNFTKFLVGRRAESVKRFPPTKAPGDLESAIETLLSRE